MLPASSPSPTRFGLGGFGLSSLSDIEERLGPASRPDRGNTGEGGETDNDDVAQLSGVETGWARSGR